MTAPNDPTEVDVPDRKPVQPPVLRWLPKYLGRTRIRTTTVILVAAFVLCGWAYLSLNDSLVRNPPRTAAPVVPTAAPTTATEPVLPNWLENLRPSYSTTTVPPHSTEPSGSGHPSAASASGTASAHPGAASVPPNPFGAGETSASASGEPGRGAAPSTPMTGGDTRTATTAPTAAAPS